MKNIEPERERERRKLGLFLRRRLKFVATNAFRIALEQGAFFSTWWRRREVVCGFTGKNDKRVWFLSVPGNDEVSGTSTFSLP